MSVVLSRMIDDLAGLLKGELRIDPLTRAMYATDASLYQMLPYGVLIPKDRDDVLTVVKYCDEMKIPLVPRGAGTGVAGSAIGNGLVIDFSRSMREIVSIGDETVTVQPGVVYERLNQRLREEGRYFPPDPSGNWTTTLGSMLAVDGAGSHSGRVGSTRDHVLTLDLVMANGNFLRAMLEPLSYPPGTDSGVPSFKRDLVSKLAQLLL
ncbi:MAG: FAD-binding oxidoreductase, partial [Planctomycetaceae bacterium]|nr:FAD-binding oxidoreductase [Planctomycetaceae bacterium]